MDDKITPTETQAPEVVVDTNFAGNQIDYIAREEAAQKLDGVPRYIPGRFTKEQRLQSDLPEQEKAVADKATDIYANDKKLALGYDVPLQAVGAVRDAANSIKNLGIDLSYYGSIAFGVKQTKEDIASAKDATKLPEVPESDRTVLKIGRGLAQFLIPYAGVAKVGLLANVTKAGPATTGLVNGFITDVSAFDETEGNLSAMAKELGFESSLTNWLAGDEDDSAIAKRLKNGLEGAGLGVMFETTFKAMKAAKGVIYGKTEAKVLAEKTVKQKTSLKSAKTALVDLSDGRKTRVPQRTSKTEVTIDAQRRAAEALNVSYEDVVSGKVFEGLDQVKVRNKINSLALVEEKAFNDFSSMSADLAQRLSFGDTAAREDFVEGLLDVFEVNNTVLDSIQDISRIQGFRGNVKAIEKTNQLREALATASDDEFDDLIMAFAELKDNPNALDTMLKSISGDMEKLAKGQISWKERTDQWFMNSILSSPVTLVSDTVSNVVFTTLAKGIEKPIAAGIGGLRHMLGGSSDKVAIQESSVFFKSMFDDSMDLIRLMKQGYDRAGVKGAVKGVKESAEQLRIDNMTRFGAHRGRGYITDEVIDNLPPIQAMGAKFLNNAGTFPTAFMQGKDDIAKGMLYRSAVKERALRRALNEGLSGGALDARVKELMISPVDDIANNMKTFTAEGRAQFDAALAKYGKDATTRLQIQRDAVTEARRLTFTDTPLPLSQKVNELVDLIPGGRFIVPFITTIDNLSRRGLERSPLGLLSKSQRQVLTKGGAEADEMIARMAVGTTMMYSAYNLALDGRITGDGPKDRAERDALLQAGWRPRSVLINGKYIDVSRMIGPLTFLLQGPANLAEIAKFNDGDPSDIEREIEDYLFLSAGATANTLLSQSWARGLANLFDDIASQDEKKLERTVANLAASFTVPNAVTFLANEINPQLQVADTYMERVKAKVGITVRPKHDLFGDKITRDDYLSIFLPATESNLKKVPEWKQKLAAAGAFPAKPSKRVGIQLAPGMSEEVELDNDQYEEYLSLIGKTQIAADMTAKDLIKKVVEAGVLPEVKNIPGSGQSLKETVSMVYSEASKIAVQELVERHPELRERARLGFVRKVTTPDLSPMSAAITDQMKAVRQ